MEDRTKKQFDRWVSEWREGFTHISDLTAFAETLIEKSDNLEFFYASPDEIRERILEHVAEFERVGKASYQVSRTGDTIDTSATMSVIARLLNAAGVKK